jgi:hypothetical protein
MEHSPRLFILNLLPEGVPAKIRKSITVAKISPNQSENVFLPAGEVMLVPVNELGQEQNAQGHGHIVAKQILTADPLSH